MLVRLECHTMKEYDNAQSDESHRIISDTSPPRVLTNRYALFSYLVIELGAKASERLSASSKLEALSIIMVIPLSTDSLMASV